MPLCRAGLGVWLILASLAACAQDDEAAAARAAREYCRALAMERYDLAWDLLTEETRNWYRECAEGQRRPEEFRKWEGGRSLAVGTSVLPAGPPATPEDLFRDGVSRRPPLADLWSGWLEEPRVLVRKDGTALAGWPGGRCFAVLVRQQGRFLVEPLCEGVEPLCEGDVSDWYGLSRVTQAGPFGRDLASWVGLSFRSRLLPADLRPPWLFGVANWGEVDRCVIYVERDGATWIRQTRCADRSEVLTRLSDHAWPRDHHDPEQPSLRQAYVVTDRRLPWRLAWDILLAIGDPGVRYRDLFVETEPVTLPRFFQAAYHVPVYRGFRFTLDTRNLRVKCLWEDARVEIAVGPEDVRAGRLARLPGVWAAVPEERKVQGVRLILDGDLTFEDALRAILAVAALNPARIVLGARAEIDPEIEPVTLDLATAPAVEPPPAPAPFPWPIPLTIHHGEIPAEWIRDRR